MKKFNYLLVVLFATLLFFGCKKKEEVTAEPTPTPVVPAGITVEEKNMSLVNKFTGSLCGPCGSWGWTMFEDIINTGGNDACNLGTYSQNFVAQNYITTAATQMDVQYGAAKNSSGYPTFSVNGVSQLSRPGGSVNTTAERQMCLDAISSHKNAPCQVNSGYELTYDANKTNMTIKTKVKFFKDMTGTYYVSAYIVEDGVIGPQSGQTGNVAHHDVLRGSIGNTFGTEITSQTTAGSTFEYTFNNAVTAGWKTDNISIVTVIWKKVGSNYTFVNAYRKI